MGLASDETADFGFIIGDDTLNMPWLKLWTEARNDGKLWSLPVDARWTWFCLLCYAAQKSRTGKVEGTTAVIAAEILHGDEQKLIEHVELLKRLEIVEVTACNTDVTSVTFKKFTKRQKKRPSDGSLQVRERVAKCRKKKRSAESVTTHVTTTCNDGNATVTPKCNAELDLSSIEDKRRQNNTAPPPGDGSKEPEFPNPDTSAFIVMTGTHPEDEKFARRTWTTIWNRWKSLKLCVGFYEHQCWYSTTCWTEAIREVAKKPNFCPSGIGYIEAVASDVEINGPKVHAKPVCIKTEIHREPSPSYHQHMPSLAEKFGPQASAGAMN